MSAKIDGRVLPFSKTWLAARAERGLVVPCIGLLVWVVVASEARPQARQANPYLPAAERLYRSLEFEEALRTIERAATWPSNSPSDDVHIALLEGRIRAALGHEELATRAFKRALAIDPTASLPASESPKVRALFERAARELVPSSPPTQVAPAVETDVPKAREAAAVPAAPPVVVQPAKSPPPPEIAVQRHGSGIPWWVWLVGGVVVGGGVAVGGILLFHPQPPSPTLGTMNTRGGG